MKKILSTQNPLVKHLVKLRDDKTYRHEQGFLVIEGKKLVNEICVECSAKSVLLTHSSLLSDQAKAERIYQVSEAVIKKIAASKNPEGIVAEVPFPKEDSLDDFRFVVALDGVSNPGNLGTLVRTALALGWQGMFLLDNCCDPFNDKALRSAKGATFRLPLRIGSYNSLAELVKKNRLCPIAADIKGQTLKGFVMPERVLLILGSEAHGLSSDTRKDAKRITIPIEGPMESLNVATAGAILMYTIKNQ